MQNSKATTPPRPQAPKAKQRSEARKPIADTAPARAEPEPAPAQLWRRGVKVYDVEQILSSTDAEHADCQTT